MIALSDVVDELTRLQDLRDTGVLSGVEFDVLKGDVLRRATSPEVVAAPLIVPQLPPPSGPHVFQAPSLFGVPMAPVQPPTTPPKRAGRTFAIIAASLVGIGAIAFGVVKMTSSDAGDSTDAVDTGQAGDIAAVPDVEGIEFVDPQGTYTITVDDTWTETSGTFVKEVEAWRIGRPLDGFAANVNVLTQDALGKDLQEYMDFSAENMGAFQLIDHQIVEGVGGHELGLLEYTGSVNTGAGTRQLHFLATVDVIDGQAVVATLTTDEGGFLAEQAVVEPYLLTLRAT